MTYEEREIWRKKRVLEHADRTGNIRKTCRYFAVPRSLFYLWRNAYRERGDEGLLRRKRVPRRTWNQTPNAVVVCGVSRRWTDLGAELRDTSRRGWRIRWAASVRRQAGQRDLAQDTPADDDDVDAPSARGAHLPLCGTSRAAFMASALCESPHRGVTQS